MAGPKVLLQWIGSALRGPARRSRPLPTESPEASPLRLIIGLGNPGPGYAGNRHNIGFMAAEAIARHYGFGPWRSRFHGVAAEGQIAGEKILVLKPGTYMNESGRAAEAAAKFYKLEPAALLDPHLAGDEVDLVM